MSLIKGMLTLNLFVIALVSGDGPINTIVGGFETSIEDNPWQVSLQIYGSHSCGGSIIGNKWVLTAAHCTGNSNASAYSVRVGSSFYAKEGTIIPVKRVIRHKNYDAYVIDFDFSLLELAEALSFSDKLKAIALPDEDIVVEDGEVTLVSGWGATYDSDESNARLRAAFVPVANQEYCDQQYKSLGRSITAQMICAGFEEGGKDSCQGDSGGPMSVQRDGVRVVVGVVSWGRGCAEPKYPGVYSRVSSVRAWIKNESGF